MEYKSWENSRLPAHGVDNSTKNKSVILPSTDVTDMIESIKSSQSKEELLQKIDQLNFDIRIFNSDIKNYEDSGIENILIQQISQEIENGNVNEVTLLISFYANWLFKVGISVDVPTQLMDNIFIAIDAETKKIEEGQPYNRLFLETILSWLCNIVVVQESSFNYLMETTFYNVLPRVFRNTYERTLCPKFIISIYSCLCNNDVSSLEVYGEMFDVIFEKKAINYEGVAQLFYDCIQLGQDFIFYLNDQFKLAVIGEIKSNGKELRFAIKCIDAVLKSGQDNSVSNVIASGAMFSLLVTCGVEGYSEEMGAGSLQFIEDILVLMRHFVEQTNFDSFFFMCDDSVSDFIKYCICNCTYKAKINGMKLLFAFLCKLNEEDIYNFISETVALDIADCFDSDDSNSFYITVKILIKFAEAGLRTDPSKPNKNRLMVTRRRKFNYFTLCRYLESEDFVERIEESKEGAPEDYVELVDELCEKAGELYDMHASNMFCCNESGLRDLGFSDDQFNDEDDFFNDLY